MARSKTADASWNARRRYFRAAERNLAKAEGSTGATAEKYRQLARQQTEKALETYSEAQLKRGARSKSMQRLTQELGIDVSTYEVSSSSRARAVERSESQLESHLGSADVRREAEARALLNNPTIGHRIIGGLVDVWQDAATNPETGKVDQSKILPALFDYFGVDNVADMLDKLEKAIGADLYKMNGDSDDLYEYVKILIQNKLLDGSLVS